MPKASTLPRVPLPFTVRRPQNKLSFFPSGYRRKATVSLHPPPVSHSSSFRDQHSAEHKGKTIRPHTMERPPYVSLHLSLRSPLYHRSITWDNLDRAPTTRRAPRWPFFLACFPNHPVPVAQNVLSSLPHVVFFLQCPSPPRFFSSSFCFLLVSLLFGVLYVLTTPPPPTSAWDLFLVGRRPPPIQSGSVLVKEPLPFFPGDLLGSVPISLDA